MYWFDLLVYVVALMSVFGLLTIALAFWFLVVAGCLLPFALRGVFLLWTCCFEFWSDCLLVVCWIC